MAILTIPNLIIKVDNLINTNGVEAITGNILNDVLNDAIDSLENITKLNLEDVLANGNATGANSIKITTGQNITFQNSGYDLFITTSTLTSDRNISFQDKAGIVALLSDITAPDGNGIFSSSNNGGTISSTFSAVITDTLTFGDNLVFINETTDFIGIGTATQTASEFFNVNGPAYFQTNVSMGWHTPSARLHIKGSGATPATKSLYIGNSVSTEKFFVRDDGMVSATDGYSINAVQMFHTTLNGDAGDTSSNNIFLGKNTPQNAGGTTSQGISNIVIGTSSLSNMTIGIGNIGVGESSLGSLNGVTQRDNIAIGKISYNAMTTGQFNIGVGVGSGTNVLDGNSNISIGWGSGASTSGTYVSSLALGRESKFNGNNQVVFGSASYYRNFYFGRGVEQATLDNNGIKFQATSVSNGVTDSIYNYPFIIAGSQGTGTGYGGDIIFKTAPAGSTGSTQNPLITAMTIQGDGVVVFKSFTIATLPTVVSGGMIRVSDEIGGDTLAYSDGTNWLRMIDGAIAS